MKKIKKIILLGLILILLLSLVVNSQSMGVISGKVLPVESNAMVYVNDIHSGENFGSARINSAGEYNINVPYGFYDVLIVGEGDYASNSVKHLLLAEDIPNIELEDVILSKKGETGSISGYVNPAIEGANVLIKEFGKEDFDDSMILSKDGFYEFTNLKPATYGLFVREANGYYDYRWGQIDINANIIITDFNLTLSPATNKYLIDRIIIEFIPGLSESEKNNIINSYRSKVMSHYSYSTNYCVSLPAGKTVDETIELFKKNAKIKNPRHIEIGSIIELDEKGKDPSKEDRNQAPSKHLEQKKDEIEEKSEPKKELSWFGKIIQFFKNLFGIK